jgi:hypothetical protein
MLGGREAIVVIAVTTNKASTKFYTLREILVVVLLLAIATLTILAFSVALILCREGMVWAILWTKSGFARFARLAGLRPGAPNLVKEMSEAKC